MTEVEWLTATDPVAMLDFLQGRASDRKLRLFAVACCHRLTGLLTKRGHVALRAAELFADDDINRRELDLAIGSVGRNSKFSSRRYAVMAVSSACFPIRVNAQMHYAADLSARSGVMAAYYRITSGTNESRQQVESAERQAQADLLRCIIGNPFAPVAFDPAWRSETAHAHATGIYEERAFDRLSILADALEEAGCDHPDVLAHCRVSGPHARGCWVVDGVLGSLECGPHTPCAESVDRTRRVRTTLGKLP